MKIAEILTRERVLYDIDLSSKKAALETLAGLIAGADNSLNAEEVFNSLLSRERLGGTGLGNGIALPHGRLEDGFSTIAAFIRLKQGVDYGASDRQPVDLIFALLVPEHSTEQHLHILKQLAGIFDRPEFLARLRGEKSRETIFKLLTGEQGC